MQNFQCHCGTTLYFENDRCLSCGRSLGYLADVGVLSALEPEADGLWRALANDGRYRQCANYRRERVCNWMVPEEDGHAFCPSCRLNQLIPNLSEPRNHLRWYRVEVAKRRLLYTLLRLGLPINGRDVDPERGLAFEFLENPREAEFSDDFADRVRVITGHLGGVITINIAEAEHSAREKMREKMNEQYRTLLGHFRHESGHYYWDRLVGNNGHLDTFRALFGHETDDYQAAIARHYGEGPPADWPARFVSAYASMHPWEDWAETWAHYLHMVDTLETAADHGFRLEGRPVLSPFAPGGGGDFAAMLAEWKLLTAAMNDLNRSMGLGDAYPFGLPPPAVEKLQFVHRVVRGG